MPENNPQPNTPLDNEPLNKAHRHCLALSYWYASAQGQALQQQIAQAMPKALARVTGTEHVQVCEGEWDELQNGTRVLSYVDVFDEPVDGVGMSFPKNSLDSVVLINTVDVAEQAQQVLHIADKLVTKSGTIVLVSFNPYSVLGLKYLCSKCLPKRFSTHSPWQSGFYSKPKLEDWLHVLNYDVRAFPLNSEVDGTASRLKKIKLWARKYGILPNFEPVNILVAKKPWFPMTGVKSGFKKKPIQTALAGIAIPKPSSTCEKHTHPNNFEK